MSDLRDYSRRENFIMSFYFMTECNKETVEYNFFKIRENSFYKYNHDPLFRHNVDLLMGI